MTLKLHPSIEKKAEQLADFHNCVDLSHFISDLLKEAAERKDFQAWLSKKSSTSDTAESAKPKGKSASKPGHVNGAILTGEDTKTQGASA